MRYHIKERVLAIRDKFDITDESGATVYTVTGKWFSFGDKLRMHDARGNEVAAINQRLLAIGPTYEIEQGGGVVSVVKKQLFTLLRHRFFVDVPGPDDLEVTGSFFEREFIFERHGATVAEVSKRWIAIGDSYVANVSSGQDPVLILATVIVIDMVLFEKKG
ncbi:LURP-one-related/scramblase family protein [soil metagenome]